jgi:hypothetical protein
MPEAALLDTPDTSTVSAPKTESDRRQKGERNSQIRLVRPDQEQTSSSQNAESKNSKELFAPDQIVDTLRNVSSSKLNDLMITRKIESSLPESLNDEQRTVEVNKIKTEIYRKAEQKLNLLLSEFGKKQDFMAQTLLPNNSEMIKLLSIRAISAGRSAEDVYADTLKGSLQRESDKNIGTDLYARIAQNTMLNLLGFETDEKKLQDSDSRKIQDKIKNFKTTTQEFRSKDPRFAHLVFEQVVDYADDRAYSFSENLWITKPAVEAPSPEPNAQQAETLPQPSKIVPFTPRQPLDEAA